MKIVTVCLMSIGCAFATNISYAQDYGEPLLVEFEEQNLGLSCPDWSPDGKWITFGKRMFDGDTYHSDIMLVPAEGGAAVNLTAGIDYDCFIPRFTPDSRQVIFTRNIMGSETEKGIPLERTDLESIDIDTGGHGVFLVDAFAGSFSHDGRFLACGRYKQGTPGYYLYDMLKREMVFNFILYDTQYSDLFFIHGHPCVGPGNNHIVTTLLEDGVNPGEDPGRLYTISTQTGEAEILGLGGGTTWYPEYSPDGKWMLYSLLDYDTKDFERNVPKSSIHVYNTETGTYINLLPDDTIFSRWATWSPDGRKICYVYDDNGTYELYICDFEFANASDDISDDIQLSVDNETPSAFEILGNYPNPFNPSTTIEFSLAEAGTADISLYNVAGQKVRELLSGSIKAGVHTVVWDGRDDSGLAVSAGVYIVKMTMGSSVTAKSIMLVK